MLGSIMFMVVMVFRSAMRMNKRRYDVSMKTICSVCDRWKKKNDVKRKNVRKRQENVPVPKLGPKWKQGKVVEANRKATHH